MGRLKFNFRIHILTGSSVGEDESSKSLIEINSSFFDYKFMVRS